MGVFDVQQLMHHTDINCFICLQFGLRLLVSFDNFGHGNTYKRLEGDTHQIVEGVISTCK